MNTKEDRIPYRIKSNDLNFCDCVHELQFNLPHKSFGIYEEDFKYIPIITLELYVLFSHKFDII